MQRFNTFLTILTLFFGSILMAQIGKTGEHNDTDGSLVAKTESKAEGPRVKSKARASSGSDIVDGIYDVYAEVDGSVDEKYDSYSGGIYKLARKTRPKQHDTTGEGNAMIDGFDNMNVLFVAVSRSIFP